MDRITQAFYKPTKLYTQRLVLRHLTKKDTKDMFEYASNPEVTRYLLWAPHEDLRYTKSYLKRVENSYKKGEFFDFGVELKSEKKLIGTCGIASYDSANSCAEIGYVINPLYKGLGYATEAVRAVLEYCFEELDFNRVEARYMIGNDASRRVMEKSGLVFEGVKRDGIFVKDGYVDIGVCAILKKDFINVDK